MMNPATSCTASASRATVPGLVRRPVTMSASRSPEVSTAMCPHTSDIIEIHGSHLSYQANEKGGYPCANGLVGVAMFLLYVS